MADENWIVTAPKGGRRRAGLRWGEGDTTVEPDGQSDELWDSINSDERMQIRADAGGPADPVKKAVTEDGPRVPELFEVEAAIGTLKLADFTTGADPKPKTGAIEVAIASDVKVSAALRDAAWVEMVARGAVVPTA